MFIFRKKKDQFFSKSDLYTLYTKTVTHCRQGVFYTEIGIADTLPGRFGLVVLHLFLLMDRLGMGSEDAQGLFDTFFRDMDRSMRENGVGDLAVPKRMKKMMAAFYEDINTYQTGLNEKNIAQILYNGETKYTTKMTEYVLRQKEMLDECTLEALLTFDFTL